MTRFKLTDAMQTEDYANPWVKFLPGGNLPYPMDGGAWDHRLHAFDDRDWDLFARWVGKVETAYEHSLALDLTGNLDAFR